MKRFLTHPSLPLIAGIIAILLAGAALAVSLLFPNIFAVRVVEAPRTAVANIINSVIESDSAEATSTTAVSASYVLDIRDQYLREKKTFVEADLTSMQLKVYRDGETVIDVPIKSKGKEGSWWETPVGVYSVKNKEKSHFSSFGHVYQPWSLVFQGNFFIHGWPYYPDGSPVSSQYSGGCIRLADENAEAVFNAVDIGTPVLVYKHQKDAPQLPVFESNPSIDDAYAVVDVPSGSTIRSRDAGSEIPFGSVVNLLTALTAVDYINVENTVPIDASNSARLASMSRVSVLDLLRLMLSEGDADAARAIASARGEASFVKNMNAKAAAIGMAHTRVNSVYANDPLNRTTIADAALLARYLAENRSFVLQLTKSAKGNAIYDPPAWSDLRFNESLLALPGFFGGIAENIEGAPALAVITIPIDGVNRQIVISVTDDADPQTALHAVATWLQK